MKPFVIYYLAVNLVSFLMYGADKLFAKLDMWRISEKALLSIAAIGGAFGAFFGMELFRHKTKHTKFTVLVPLLMAAHFGILVFVFIR